MQRRALTEWIVFFALLAAGVAVRMQLQYLPNFAPVAALALFAGYYFRSPLMALALPLCVMAISDHFIGVYQPLVMSSVYVMLALPVAARYFLRECCPFGGRRSIGVVGWACGLLACNLAASLLFFGVTNGAHWWHWANDPRPMYDFSVAGLTQCYIQALPFFRYTLAGDLFFAVALFGGYGVCASLAAARSNPPRRISCADGA